MNIYIYIKLYQNPQKKNQNGIILNLFVFISIYYLVYDYYNQIRKQIHTVEFIRII
ncbi:Uncharacterised protein [Chlamydia trachomatis]|nr:Uncharacterised protein [Chlamydia trachomatis]